MTQSVTTQQSFAEVDDDGGANAGTLGTTNANWTQTVDQPIRVRFLVNTIDKDETDGYHLYQNYNGGGYAQVTTSSTEVKAVASGFGSPPTDGTATTERLSGPDTFVAGQWVNDGIVDSMTIAVGEETELEFCIELVGTDVVHNNTILFEVRFDNGGSLDGYTNRPTVTVDNPVGQLTQINFRIRNTGDDGDSELINANGAGDWSEAINTNHIGIPSPKRAGICLGLRIEVEETVSTSRTWTPRLKMQKNGTGGYIDLATENHNDQRTLVNSVEIGIIPTDRFTDAVATTNILSGSAKAFVAGTGEHQATAASNTLNNQHTEIEWRIFVNKIWDGTTVGNVDGDFFDFRVYDNDTALEVYTVTPRITLDYDNDYIGGTYPESIGNYGPFIASDGDIFTIVEDSELVGQAKLLRRASGQTEWTIMDQANEPGGFLDLEAFHVHQIGDTLHLFYQGGSTRYETVNLSTHAWGGLDELIDAAVPTLNQQVCGARRSDNTTICVYVDASDDLVYKERSSGGTWDTGSTNILTGTVSGVSCVLAASDKIYIAFYQDVDATVLSRSLSSSNVLGTQRTITTNGRTGGAGVQWAVIAPIYWDDGGTEKIGIIYQEETDAKLYWRIIDDDGAPATASVVTDNAVTDNEEDINTRQPAANAVVDGDQIYVVFSRASTDFDVYYTVSDNGAAFGTDIEIQDAVIVHAVGANIYTSGGKVLAYITETAHADGSPEYSGFTGGVAYFEESIAVAGNVVPVFQEDTLGLRLLKGATL